nr:hypothetical protein [Tanacetum cinerariifolium]
RLRNGGAALSARAGPHPRPHGRGRAREWRHCQCGLAGRHPAGSHRGAALQQRQQRGNGRRYYQWHRAGGGQQRRAPQPNALPG